MEEKSKHRKPYEKPTLTKLTPEQAAKTRKPYERPTITKLTREQAMGDQGAKDLLELAFPELTGLPEGTKADATTEST